MQRFCNAMFDWHTQYICIIANLNTVVKLLNEQSTSQVISQNVGDEYLGKAFKNQNNLYSYHFAKLKFKS